MRFKDSGVSRSYSAIPKLAIAALSFTTAVTLAQYVIPFKFLIAAAALLCLPVIPGFIIRGNRGLVICIMSIASAFGLLWFWGHGLLYVQAGERYVDLCVTSEARVLDFPKVYDNYSSVTIKLTGDNVPNLKTELYIYDDYPELEPGDTIKADLKFKSAIKRYDEITGRYTSKGKYLLAYLDGGIDKTGKWRYSFLHAPMYLNLAIKQTITEIFPADVLGFETALLTGDTSLLYKDKELSIAMGVSGIMHIVSVSGMHVAFLVGMVRSITGRRRRTAAICIPMILLFIPMVGANPAVIRASVMQIMLLIAPLIRRENDNLTSLSFVLALLLLANPSSVQDIGLQLSFAAMAGIYLVTPSINSALLKSAEKLVEIKYLGSVVRFVISSLASTIGALVFSTPLTAFHFGYISLVAPITNILILSAVSVSFTLGYVCCAIGVFFSGIGSALAWGLAWVIRYILLIIKFLGSIPFAALYTSNPLISVWLGLTYLFFGVCWFFKGNRTFRLPVPASLSVAALAIVLLYTSFSNHWYTGILTVMDVGQGQSVVISSGSSAVVLDCGGEVRGSAGNIVSSYLLGRNITKVDALILSHLHRDHADGAAELISRLSVNKLIIPPGDSDDDGLLEEILLIAKKHSTEVVFLESDASASVGSLSFNLYAPVGNSSMNERGIVVHAAVGDFKTLITGDINSATEKLLMRKTILPEADLLIVGHHGSKHSTSEELLEAIRPNYAAISSGNNNYGHPTPDAMGRLDDAEAAVYRTDLSGNITFKVK